MTDKTREALARTTTTSTAKAFKAVLQGLTHADMPGGNLWDVTSVHEKALMLKVWQAAGPAAVEAELVPDGWVLVPKEPTQAMDVAGGDEIDTPAITALEDEELHPDDLARRIYKAMLAAAPTQERTPPWQD